MLGRLGDCYMIDLASDDGLASDDDLVPFCSRLGGSRLDAISWRNYERLTEHLRRPRLLGMYPPQVRFAA